MQTVELRQTGHRLRLEVDPQDLIGARIVQARRFYESDLLEDMRRRARVGTAIDVGAHIGNHSVFMAGAMGMQVVSFEPDRANHAQLIRNIELNGLAGKVTVFPAAAGARPGYGYTEALKPGNSGMTRVVRHESGSVSILTIDGLGLQNVTLIKIDTEGFEMEVLEGARETITRDRPILYIEAEGERHEPVKRFMESLGYREFGCYAKTPTYGYAPGKVSKPVTLSVAIMAHRKRAGFVEYLQDKLDATVVWDEREDRWDTGRRSLLSYDPAATHHAVIQDDALIPQNLAQGIANVVAVRPHSPISLYTGRQRPNGPLFIRMMERARQHDASWLAWPQVCWGVGLVFPTEMIPPMVAYADQRTRILNYDMRLSTYLESERMPMFYTVPSLVDHRAGAENPSLVPGRTGTNRVAHRFIGQDVDASVYDWRGGLITSPRAQRHMVCPVCGALDYDCSVGA